MLIRVLSDIHGNIEALEAVLDHPAGKYADVTLCLGDIVGYGAEPGACISTVKETADITVMGNHDSGVCNLTPLEHFNFAGATAIQWTRNQLSEKNVDYLNSLPLESSCHGYILCHSYPPDPGSWEYILFAHQAIKTNQAKPGLLCFVGHTHLPCVWSRFGIVDTSETGRLEENLCIINCGSTGQPRDRNPKAAYLLVDTEKKTYRHVRVKYDIDSAAEKIRRAGLPEILWRRLYEGR